MIQCNVIAEKGIAVKEIPFSRPRPATLPTWYAAQHSSSGYMPSGSSPNGPLLEAATPCPHNVIVGEDVVSVDPFLHEALERPSVIARAAKPEVQVAGRVHAREVVDPPGPSRAPRRLLRVVFLYLPGHVVPVGVKIEHGNWADGRGRDAPQDPVGRGSEVTTAGERDRVRPEFATYLEKVGMGEHDMALYGGTESGTDPDFRLYYWFSSDAATEANVSNISYYKNPEVDRLIAQARSTLDQKERRDLYYRVQEIVHEDVAVLPLAYVNDPVGLQKGVKGCQTTLGRDRFNTVKFSGGA
jgi:hypothetical protein